MKTFVLIERIVGNGHLGTFSCSWWEKGERYKGSYKLYNMSGGWNFILDSDLVVMTVKGKDWSVVGTKEMIAKTTEYQQLVDNSSDKSLKIGWLSPEGKMHYCLYQDHISYAHLVLESNVPDLEKQGWLHIIHGVSSLYSRTKRITQAQAITAREELGLKVNEEDIIYQ